ncbi:MAG: hypothetical protein ACRD8U_03245, partial [Pyrinomonadaceae bacterium]
MMRGRVTLRMATVSLILSFWLFAQGQSPTKSPQRKAEKPGDEASVDVETRWRPLLDQLIVEARSMPEESDRIYALAELADAYWSIDKAKSAEQFVLT